MEAINRRTYGKRKRQCARERKKWAGKKVRCGGCRRDADLRIPTKTICHQGACVATGWTTLSKNLDGIFAKEPKDSSLLDTPSREDVLIAMKGKVRGAIARCPKVRTVQGPIILTARVDKNGRPSSVNVHFEAAEKVRASLEGCILRAVKHHLRLPASARGLTFKYPVKL